MPYAAAVFSQKVGVLNSPRSRALRPAASLTHKLRLILNLNLTPMHALFVSKLCIHKEYTSSFVLCPIHCHYKLTWLKNRVHTLLQQDAWCRQACELWSCWSCKREIIMLDWRVFVRFQRPNRRTHRHWQQNTHQQSRKISPDSPELQSSSTYVPLDFMALDLDRSETWLFASSYYIHACLIIYTECALTLLLWGRHTSHITN